MQCYRQVTRATFQQKLVPGCGSGGNSPSGRCSASGKPINPLIYQESILFIHFFGCLSNFFGISLEQNRTKHCRQYMGTTSFVAEEHQALDWDHFDGVKLCICFLLRR
jgi:hypothetical protein